ncbi:hypothetical protein G4Z05_04555 [Bacillus thermocopriae]|uniref:Uncharacterized protein n=1 Tax=Neobacillus thermocopriae TaxID=1215031 RepID=A0A6B3TPY2_9BACI|nr:hypothetical protein [Neobacillus thermocopriae]
MKFCVLRAKSLKKGKKILLSKWNNGQKKELGYFGTKLALFENVQIV